MSIKLSKYLIIVPEETALSCPGDKLLLFSLRTAKLIKMSVFAYRLLKSDRFDGLPDTLFMKLVENEILISAKEFEFESIIQKHIAIAADLQQALKRSFFPAPPVKSKHSEANSKAHSIKDRKWPLELRYQFDAAGEKKYFPAGMADLLMAQAPICCDCICFPVCGAKIPKLPGTVDDCPIRIEEIRALITDTVSFMP
ncbi:hypothetical protein MTO98_07220 [Mucilaginibacter sp. SMC90]|uniref:hypothetical protein n=1 Tax=Mucilaginibacter sp. SMC90 TaxID=2929803 RepID=UPI001FB3FDA1|nr:hypothetical protein [Mucilaginibacter sp. SMC90]UOE50866.1 hypothetical protein MTO98_07220 [Mucilaginibacter sp. SMC90]